jgi:PEP-CTERM motif-containing protein
MLMATWTGTIDGVGVVAQISPTTPTRGTITFSLPPPGTLGLLVDYIFYNQTEFSLNGGAFVSTPLTGVSAPIPEASTWAMMLMGFAGLCFASYRRTAGAIPLG